MHDKKNHPASLPNQAEALQGLFPKLLSNFSWLFAGTAGKIIIRFMASLYLARVLGPLGFGQLAFAQAILAYFILFTDSGLQTFGTREIAAGSEEKGQIVGKILPIRLALALSSLTIILTLAPLFTPSTATKNLLILFSFTLIPDGANLGWFFRGLEKMKIVGISDLLQIGFYFALILLLVKSYEQIFLVPIFFVGSYLVSTLYLSGIYSLRWKLPRLCVSIKDNWKVFRTAFPIVTILFFLQIYYNLDILMLGIYRSEAEVGLYNAAYRIIMGIITLNTVLMLSVYPTFSKLFQEKPFEARKLLQKTLSLSMVIAVPIGIAGTTLSRPLMVTLFGSAFAEGRFALQLLVWSALLELLAANYGYCLVACHQQKALAISVGIGTAANIGLNFLLIPGHGIIGASVATILAQLIMLIIQVTVFSRRAFPTFPSISNTLKVLAAGFIMGLVYILLNHAFNFFLLLVTGGAVYFLILWLLGGVPILKLMSFRKG